ncbi:MAG: GNAT family N-acetyltransferase [Desulfovibrio sp.]|nr:GNAT family N-acetyltransferase [Desulfovibrio sp.]
MLIRKAAAADLDAVAAIYAAVHTAEEAGRLNTGWIRDVYPTRVSASRAQAAGELFVLEENGLVSGAGIINKSQHEAYAAGSWQTAAKPETVMVLHTLAIDPASSAKGLGRAFLRFYAEYALANNCPNLRLDTNAVNLGARAFYKKMGFREVGSVKTPFNGIAEVCLILLEAQAEEILGGLA